MNILALPRTSVILPVRAPRSAPLLDREKDRHHVTALARGLKILRCFTHERPELGASEIVRLTQLPQPTVWRLCRTLQRSGFIVGAGERGRMSLGIPVLTLGYAALVRQSLPEIALPYMRSLTERHRLGTSIGVRDGLEMVYVQRTHGDFNYFNDPIGARRPIATAPTGWACLAAYDALEFAAVMKALKRQDPRHWKNTQRHIERAIEDYRRYGFILSIGVMHEQANAVAVPIVPLDGGAVHGLSASGLASIWPRDKLLVIGAELIALARDLKVVHSKPNP